MCHGGAKGPERICLGARVHRTTEGEITYTLVAEYSGNRPLKVPPGQSIEVELDGELRTFSSPEGSLRSRDTLPGGLVKETVAWEVRRKDLEDLAHSEDCQFLLIGSEALVERCLSLEQRAPFRDFLEKTKDKDFNVPGVQHAIAGQAYV